jgi:hypothetical protein
MIGTAIAVLGGGAAALASANQNNYKGSSLKISKSKTGALSMVETLNASNNTSGNRAAPLTDVVVKIQGVKLDVGKLPTCSDAKIEQASTQPTGKCSPNSVIGSGRVNALLGPRDNPSASKGTACNPYLNVFNGGPSTQVFFFYTKSSSDCNGLTTGSTKPYDGHISYSGGYAVINVPLPPDVSTEVPNPAIGLYGSLIHEALNFGKTVGGKVYMASTSCKGSRKWSITFTASKFGGGSETSAPIKGTAAC